MIKRRAYPITVPMKVSEDSDDYLYLLLEPFIYEWVANGKRYRFVIPARFLFDGASVPRLFWSLTGITRDGLERAAACIHDMLYGCRGIVPAGWQQVYDPFTRIWRDCPAGWTRKQVDKLFARMLGEYGVTRRRRRVMYLAVRCGGFWPWFRVGKRVGDKAAQISAADIEAELALYRVMGRVGV